MTPEQRNVVISGQAKRFRKHRKTYADAIASAGQKAAGYVKRKLNMDKAKPKKKKKNKVVAC
jgi:predicted nucleic-acid-binding protein